jgi:hypothetical protein
MSNDLDRRKPLADYVAFLDRPTIEHQIEKAERDLKANRGIKWRQVRDDV